MTANFAAWAVEGEAHRKADLSPALTYAYVGTHASRNLPGATSADMAQLSGNCTSLTLTLGSICPPK